MNPYLEQDIDMVREYLECIRDGVGIDSRPLSNVIMVKMANRALSHYARVEQALRTADNLIMKAGK